MYDLSEEEQDVLDQIPLFGSVAIVKSLIVRSLVDKGYIRIVAIEPFRFVVCAA